MGEVPAGSNSVSVAGRFVPRSRDGLRRGLTRAEFHRFSDAPPETEWFANLDNENTRRAYHDGVGDFIRFAAIERSDDLRQVPRAHVLQWQKRLAARSLSAASLLRNRSALSELFDHLCEREAIQHNPAPN